MKGGKRVENGKIQITGWHITDYLLQKDNYFPGKLIIGGKNEYIVL